jgi:hypothetical protein
MSFGHRGMGFTSLLIIVLLRCLCVMAGHIGCRLPHIRKLLSIFLVFHTPRTPLSFLLLLLQVDLPVTLSQFRSRLRPSRLLVHLLRHTRQIHELEPFLVFRRVELLSFLQVLQELHVLDVCRGDPEVFLVFRGWT